MKDEIRFLSKCLSRREAMRTGVAGCVTLLGGTLALACKGKSELVCNDTMGMAPADLATRETNQYVDKSPDPAKICSGCQLYKDPAAEGQCAACTIVKGPINPKGYCKLFNAKVAT